jgi:Mg2+ and Co2+ transporter CorA
MSDPKTKNILDYWITERDNRTTVVAKKFGVPQKTVDDIVNRYLKEKIEKVNSKS